MAPTRTSARPRLRSTPSLAVLVGVLGICLGTGGAALPAQAAPQQPGTAQAAGALLAERGHQLELVTEQYNEAREQLNAQHAAAEAAAAAVAQAEATLATAEQRVRGIARSAYTGEGLGTFQALLTSDSADAFVDRVAVLETVAGHQNAVLDEAAAARATATRARAAAAEATAAAQTIFDAVSAQQADLQAQITAYQADYARLTAEEQRAALAAAEAAHSGEGAAGEERASTGRASRAEREAPSGPVAANSKAAQIAVSTALAQRGKPYAWAAAGPGSYDCSGLVQYAYRAAGISVPHSSSMQSKMGQQVSRDALQPGDLVFFYSPISHVGIYLGNGQMVHAPTSGDVVKISKIDSMGGYAWARRIAA